MAKAKRKINAERLIRAFEIVDGIPSNKIDLTSIQRRRGKSLACGTICCAFGWLGHHPEFQALGLKTVGKYLTTWQGEHNLMFFPTIASELFGITSDDGRHLFCEAGAGRFDEPSDCAGPNKKSDKEIWKERVRKLLKEHGQL